MLKQLALISITLSIATPAAAQQAFPQKDAACIQKAHNARVAAKRSPHARTKGAADANRLKAVKACPNAATFDPGNIGAPKVTTGSGTR